MSEKKNRIETAAIEDLVANVNTVTDARTIALLAISEFGDRYNPELPEKMDMVVDKPLALLRRLHEKGYDMGYYCMQMRDIVIAEGSNHRLNDAIWGYTLSTVDRIVYKAKIIQNKPGTKIRKKVF